MKHSAREDRRRVLEGGSNFASLIFRVHYIGEKFTAVEILEVFPKGRKQVLIAKGTAIVAQQVRVSNTTTQMSEQEHLSLEALDYPIELEYRPNVL
jgi:hypothetical protein